MKQFPIDQAQVVIGSFNDSTRTVFFFSTQSKVMSPFVQAYFKHFRTIADFRKVKICEAPRSYAHASHLHAHHTACLRMVLPCTRVPRPYTQHCTLHTHTYTHHPRTCTPLTTRHALHARATSWTHASCPTRTRHAYAHIPFTYTHASHPYPHTCSYMRPPLSYTYVVHVRCYAWNMRTVRARQGTFIYKWALTKCRMNRQ